MNSERSRDSYERDHKRVRRSRSWSSSSRSPVKRKRTSRRRDDSRAAQPGYSRNRYTRERRNSTSGSPRRYSRRSKHSSVSKSNSRGPSSAVSNKAISQSPKRKIKVEDEGLSSGVQVPSNSNKITKKEKPYLRDAKEEKELETDNERNNSDSDSSSSSSSSLSSSSSSSSSNLSGSNSDSSDSEDDQRREKKEDQKVTVDSKRASGDDAATKESMSEESGEEDGEIDSNELYTTKAEYHTRKKGHLFCAGFPLTFRSVDLMEFFQDFGAFDAKIVERAGKRFGFVDFISEERAELARFALNGKRPAGEKFPIFVTEKTERGSVSHWVRETETGGPRFKRGRRF